MKVARLGRANRKTEMKDDALWLPKPENGCRAFVRMLEHTYAEPK